MGFPPTTTKGSTDVNPVVSFEFDFPSSVVTHTGVKASVAIPIVTDWVAYTPTFTGFGTPTNVAFWSRRDGDTLEVKGCLTFGTTTNVQAQITFGFNGTNANVTSDNSGKINGNSLNTEICGYGAYDISGAFAIVPQIAPNRQYFTIGVSGAGSMGYAQVTGTSLGSSGQSISFFAKTPIQGWTATT